MHRQMLQALQDWKQSPSRQPLLIRGARQTGKTYLVEQLGQHCFEHVLTINFEKQPHFKDCFQNLDPHTIVQTLELVADISLQPGSSLLFLDEIQECPQALQALRYFFEDMPDLHIIGAGSLLEFALDDDQLRIPVGRVQFMHLYPMSLTEHLQALGKTKRADFLNNIDLNETIAEPVHNQLLNDLRAYFITGGMPRIVQLYQDHNSLLMCQQAQLDLLNTYREDFAKYASQIQKSYCERVFERSFSLIAQHFKYTDIDPDMDHRSLKRALQLLIKAHVLTPVYLTQSPSLPLSAHRIAKRFKLLFLDVGLAQAVSQIPANKLLRQNLMQINQGILTEQFVGQQLLTLSAFNSPFYLHYWKRDKKGSQAEVDYLLAVDDAVIPIEVKSGKTGRLKSLQLYMQTYQPPVGIKLSTDQLDTSGTIWSVPLYMVEQIPRLVKELIG